MLEKSGSQSEVPEYMPESPTRTPDTNVDVPTTPERYYARLTEHISNLAANTPRPSEMQRTIKQKLISIGNSNMAPIHTNILEYWRNTTVDADVLKLVKVAESI